MRFLTIEKVQNIDDIGAIYVCDCFVMEIQA